MTELVRPIDQGFVFGGVGFGPPDPDGRPGFIPSNEELRQQMEVAEARIRYQIAHPSPEPVSSSISG